MHSKRVDRLKPFNLRFHMNDGTIQFVFFHGGYSQYYKAYMHRPTQADEEIEGWSGTFDCTKCKNAMTVSRKVSIGS